jgi:DNA-binding transcriptional LysR family regulator
LSLTSAAHDSTKAGLGVSILSRATLAKELAMGDRDARSVAPQPIRRRIAAVSAPGASRLPAARELTALLAAIELS